MTKPVWDWGPGEKRDIWGGLLTKAAEGGHEYKDADDWMKGLFEQEEIRQQVGKEGSGMKVREVGRCPNPLDRREIGRRVCGFAGVCTLPPGHGENIMLKTGVTPRR